MWLCHCQSKFTSKLHFGFVALEKEEERFRERTMLTILSQLIPAPRGTALVASPAVKRLLQLAGIEDAYTSSAGSTKTLENTLKATFSAISNTYGFLTPNLWKETKLIRSPLEEFADTLRTEKRY